MKSSVIAYRPDVDGIRAIAILSVIGFHASPYACPGGFVGVDIFFVISGYLITTIILDLLQRERFFLVDFYAHRARRLLLVLASCVLFGWFALVSSEYKQLGKHVSAGALFVSNLSYWREAGYFDAQSELKPLLHLWSLGIEEQFYIFWPLILVVAWKRIKIFFAFIVLLATGSFFLNVSLVDRHTVATFYLPVTRAWELLIGSGLAYIQLFKAQEAKELLQRVIHHSLIPRDQWFVIANLSAAVGIILIFSSVARIDKFMAFPGWWALIPTAGTALVIAAGPNALINRTILSNQAIVLVGLISYPLYLWHWPILSFLRIVEAGNPSALARIVAIALAFGLAYGTYIAIERPIRKRPARSLVLSLCVLMVFIGAGGYYITRNDGFPDRLEQLENERAAFKWVLESEDGCLQAISVKSRYCRINNSHSPPTVAIVGDSHGNRLFPGLSTWFATRNENLLQLGEGGCVPFWNVEGGEIGTEDACKARINGQLEYIERSSTIKTVILTSRGPLYISGKGFGDAEKDTRTFIRYATRSDQLSYYDVFSLALHETLKRLHAANKKVVIVIDNPQLGFDPMPCLSLRPLQSARQVREPCAIPRDLVDDTNREYRSILADAARVFPDVRFIDTQAILCDERYCWAMKEGVLLYMDGDHLNKFGAEYIVSHMSEDIFK